MSVDAATGLGGIDGVGAVPRATVERLLCDCALSVNGSEERRTFSPQLRRSLALKQRCCSFPRCDRPVDWCEGHHLRRWALEGRTVAENGALLCGFHHRQVHEGGWELGRESGGWVAIAPDGNRHSSSKAPPALRPG